MCGLVLKNIWLDHIVDLESHIWFGIENYNIEPYGFQDQGIYGSAIWFFHVVFKGQTIYGFQRSNHIWFLRSTILLISIGPKI
jgi:hypothetical protein